MMTNVIKHTSYMSDAWSDQYHLHDQEEPGNNDVGEVAGEEGEEERGQDAVLRAHAGDIMSIIIMCCKW